MHVLYVCYWSFEEGLTRASAVPSVQALGAREEVEKLIFCTLERNKTSKMPAFTEEKCADALNALGKKVRWSPLFVPQKGLLGKVWEHTLGLSKMYEICQKEGVDLIWARGSMAGAMAYRLFRRLEVPFVVESFEPHAEYMRAAAVWRSYDPRYLLQRHWERKQKKYAWKLLPVAAGYAAELRKEGVSDERLHVVPCPVDLQDFAFSAKCRKKRRNELGISEKDVLAVYVGKFDQLYLSPSEAAQLFAALREAGLKKFKVLILTPQAFPPLRQALLKNGLQKDEFFLKTVPHHDVSSYLSAADFAFSLHRALPPMRFISAIKNGECWANGLPILLPKGVGDDYEIVQKEGGGVAFSLQSNYQSVVKTLMPLIALRKAGERASIVKLAAKHREKDKIKEALSDIFRNTSF